MSIMLAFSPVPVCAFADDDAPRDEPALPDTSAREYAYRLLVGFDGDMDVREGDVELGCIGSTALLGFDTPEALEGAQGHYGSEAAFVVIDGALSVADRDGNGKEGEGAFASERDEDGKREDGTVELDSVEAAEATARATRDENPFAELDDEPIVDIDLPSKAHLVALVDTGVPECDEVVGRASVVGDDLGDDNGHGTEMLQVILDENAAARVLSVKALGEDGTGSVASVYAAIEYAVAAGAEVINLSISSRAASGNAAIAKAVDDALDAGAVVVAAAGNEGDDAAFYAPGNIEGAYTVGALDERGDRLADSNYGECVDLYVEAKATSHAAARVSGWLGKRLGKGWKKAAAKAFAVSAQKSGKSPDDASDGASKREAGNGSRDDGDDGDGESGVDVDISSGDRNGESSPGDEGQDAKGPIGPVADSGDDRENPAITVPPGIAASSDFENLAMQWATADAAAKTYLELFGGTAYRFVFEFDANGGEGSMADYEVMCVDGDPDERVSLPRNAFTRDGYEFVGWYPVVPATGIGEMECACVPDGQVLENMMYKDASGDFVDIVGYAEARADSDENVVRLVAGWRNLATGGIDDGGVGARSLFKAASASRATPDDVVDLNRYATQWTYANSWSTLTGDFYYLSTSDIAPNAYPYGWGSRKALGKVTTAKTASASSHEVAYVNSYAITSVGSASPESVEDMRRYLYQWWGDIATANRLKQIYGLKGQQVKGSGFYMDSAVGTQLYWACHWQTGSHIYDKQPIDLWGNDSTGEGWGAKRAWECALDKVRLTFDGDGAGGSMPDKSVFRYVWTNLPANKFTKTGYSFDGWKASKSGYGSSGSETKRFGDKEQMAAPRDLTMTAKWQANDYCVRFYKNGGDGSMGEQQFTYDEAQKLDANGFTRAGYTFSGWNTKADGSGVGYSNRQKVSNLTAKADGVVRLYAQWSPWSYTVKFDSNGGSGSMEALSMAYGTAKALTANGFNPPSARLAFGGWNTASDGSGTSYSDKERIDLRPSRNGAVVRLYAQWVSDGGSVIAYKGNAAGDEVANVPSSQFKAKGAVVELSSAIPTRSASTGTYEVTLDPNGGTLDGSTAEKTLSASYSGGFSFKNWNTEASGTGTSYAAGATYGLDESVTLYAQWVAEGSVSAVVLPTPENGFAKFLGWALSASAADGVTGSYTPSGDVTLHAIWGSGETFQVSYDANGGFDAPASQTKAEGVPLALNSARPRSSGPDPETYMVSFDARGGTCSLSSAVSTKVVDVVFSHWNTEVAGSGAAYAPGAIYEPDESVTLYAQWRTVVSQNAVALPTPAKEGSIFAGWALDGSADSGFVGEYVPTASVTLHAIWITLEENSVTYHANGGVGEPGRQAKIQGLSLTLSEDVPVREGSSGTYTVVLDANGGECPIAEASVAHDVAYTFTGWNTREDGSGATYLPGSSYILDESVVLYAQWDEAADAGRVVLPIPTREGYRFAGWAASSSSAAGITGSFSPTGDTTLYAQWRGILTGVLNVVKEGSPISSLNEEDEFPITIELENVHGYDLSGVTVSDSDFLADRTDDPKKSAHMAAASVSNIVEGVAEAVDAASSADSWFDGNLAPIGAGTDAGKLVALIDTGVPASAHVVGRETVLGGDVDDDNGHGEAMLAAMVAQNPDVRVLSIKALDSSGRGTGASVYAAIELAIDRGADVINLSLSALDSVANGVIAKGVGDAIGKGIAVIVAAGNGGYDVKYFTPANVAGAFTVSAASASGDVLPGANRGRGVDAFVEAKSTSEATAKVSGWLSGYHGEDWEAGVGASGLAVDVGAGAVEFVGANDSPLLEQVADEVSAAATVYAMKIYYHANGGAIPGGTKQVADGDSETGYRWYRVSGNLVQSSHTSASSGFSNYYQNIKTTATYKNLNNVSTMGIAKTGYHIEGARAYNLNASGTGTSFSQDNTSPSDANPVTTKLLNGGTEITADKNVTLYINWIANTYTVTYDANGGTGAPSSTSHTYGVSSSLPSTKPSRSNYTFDGWQVDGVGTVYSAGQTVGNLTATDGGTVAMKAKWTENPKYTVTYDGNGGAASRTSDTVYSGDSVSLPSVSGYPSDHLQDSGAQRTISYDWNGGIGSLGSAVSRQYRDYSFDGWYTSASGGSYAGSSGSLYVPESSLTLFMRWTPLSYWRSVTLPSGSSVSASKPSEVVGSYTVTYDANGGTLSKGSDTADIVRSYSFGGWAASPDAASSAYQGGASYSPSGDVTLYAYWNRSDSTGAVTLPTPSRPGYDFMGWASSASAESGLGAQTSYIPPESCTLYAVWHERTYTVSFDANGGSGSMGGQTVYGAREWTVPAIAFAKDGCYAVGWNTSPDGNGSTYVPGTATMMDEDTSDVTLYAIWAENARRTITVSVRAGQGVVLSNIPDGTSCSVVDGDQPSRWSLVSPSPQVVTIARGESTTVTSESVYDQCVVSFDANGGRGSMESAIVQAGGAFVVPPCSFSRDGYRFGGWNTAADGGGVAYDVGESISVSETVRLFAQWSSPKTVSFDANGGSGSMSSSRMFADEAYTVPANEFSYDGFWFFGWNTAPDGTGISHQAGDVLFASDDVTLYAQWLSPRSGDAYAVLLDDGQLVFFRSIEPYSSGPAQQVVDIKGNEYVGYVYAGVETIDRIGSANCPWREHVDRVLSVRVAGDQVVSPVNTSYWFEGCACMERFDTAGFDTARVENFERMFAGARSLASLDVSMWETAGVRAIASMFEGCGMLGELEVGLWKVFDIADFSGVFEGCSGLTELDVSGWDVSGATTLEALFKDCSKLERVGGLDTWDTESVVSFRSLFEGCASLTSLDAAQWDTGSAVDMHAVFARCESLADLDVSGWDTSSTVDMGSMFARCASLTAVDVTGFDTSAAIDMSSMFEGIGCAFIDLSGFDTASVADMGRMFAECVDLVWLDLASFDTGVLVSAEEMYASCPELTTIYATESWVVTSIERDADMFAGCAKLVGGYGTAFDASRIDKERACIDRYGQPGYYTDSLAPAVIAYDANGGSGSMERTSVVRGHDAYVAACGFNAPSGHVFVNWNTEPDGSGTTYAAHAGLKLVTSMTLYAQWSLPDRIGSYAVLADDGDLVFFQALGSYAPGPDRSVVDIAGTAWAGHLYAGIEDTGASAPWRARAGDIVSVHVAEGSVIAPATMKAWFDGCAHLERFAADGFDSVSTASMEALFKGCSSVSVLSLAGLDASSVRSFASMFSGCSRLAVVDVSSLDVSSGAVFDSMFKGCSSIDHLDLSGFDMARVESAKDMFKGMDSLEKVDLGASFRFAGIESALPAAPSDFPYTGEWTAGAGDYTAEALAASYDGTVMAGAYVWAVKYPDFTVSFDANGGYGSMEDSPVYDGEPLVVPDCMFGHLSLAFARWNTSADGTGLDYYPGERIGPTSDVTLYAQWTGYSIVPSQAGMNGLLVTNEVDGAGSVTATYRMTFGQDGYGFPYVASDGRSGFVASGDLASIPSGEALVVYGTWEGLSYDVEQVSAGGWELALSENTSGVTGYGADVAYVFEDFFRWLEGYGDYYSEGGRYYPYFAGKVAEELGGRLPVGEALDLAVAKAMAEELGEAEAFEDLLSWCRMLGEETPRVYIGEDLDAAGLETCEEFFDGLKSVTYEDLLAGAHEPFRSRPFVALPSYCTRASFVNRDPAVGADAAYAVIQGDELVFFRSACAYSNGMQTVEDVAGTTYTGYVYADIESQEGDVAPWHGSASAIRCARFVDGQPIRPRNMHGWYEDMAGLSRIEGIANLDTSSTLDMGSLFAGCSSLASLDLSGFDTLNVMDMSSMFAGCSSLSEIGVSSFSTTRVRDFSSMFAGTSLVSALDISGFSTFRARSMDDMFSGMDALRTVMLGGDFSFVGNGTTATQLPDASTASPYTGKWYRVGSGPAVGALSMGSAELARSYNRALAGTWSWEQRVVWSPAVRVELLGMTLSAGQFSVGLYEDGRVVEMSSNAVDGGVSFAGVPFNQSGEGVAHEYVVDVANLDEGYSCEGAKSYTVKPLLEGGLVMLSCEPDEECVLSIAYHALVSFDSNGGEGEMADVRAKAGFRFSVPECSFTRAGYVFGGWSQGSDGVGDCYEAPDGPFVTGDTVLYAQWEPIQLAFSVPTRIDFALKADGSLSVLQKDDLSIDNATSAGIGVTGVKAVDDGDFELSASPGAFGEYDYWFKPVGFEKVRASSVEGAAFSSLTWKVARCSQLAFDEVAGLVAQWDALDGARHRLGALTWQIALGSVRVSFRANGATGVMGERTVSADVPFAAPSPTFAAPSGMEFSGWNTSSDGTGASYALGEVISFDEDTVLYAQWSAVR